MSFSYNKRISSISYLRRAILSRPTHQFLDLVEMFKPVTKRSKQIIKPDTVNEIVRIAFKYAQSEKPGAAHIDLPCDIAGMEVPEGNATAPIKQAQKHVEYADFENIEDAAALIFKSERPVILAGHGAVRGNAAKAIRRFSHDLKIPVVNTMMAKGIVADDSPYSMWTVGLPQDDYQNVILKEADLVITVGYDLVEFAPRKWNADNNHRIIHIDTRGNHINKLYQPDIEVIGDLSDSLDRILKRCGRTKENKRFADIKGKMEAEYRSFKDDMSFPMKPQKILYDIRQEMERNDILISDVGAHKMWIARHYRCYEPNTCIISNGFASMGISVPGAISAKLTFPDRKVLAVTGDGGFMMNCQEIETAVRLKIPFVTVIFHDDSYGLIKWKEQDKFGEDFFVDFSNPDFVKFAESMHAAGYRVTSAEEFPAILKDAFAQDRPAIIDCPVDYGENTKLTGYLKGLCEELKEEAEEK